MMWMGKFNALWAENAGLVFCLQESMLYTEKGKKRAIKMSVVMKKLLSKDTKKVGAGSPQVQVWDWTEGYETGTGKISKEEHKF